MIRTLRDLNHIYVSFSDLKEENLSPFLLSIKNENYESLKTHVSTLDNVTLEDGIVFACKFNRPNVAKFLIDSGVGYNPERKFDIFSNAYDERFTIMGHAIDNKQTAVVKLLLEKGVTLTDVFHEISRETAIDIYYKSYRYKPTPELLTLLLENGADIKTISADSLFVIGSLAPSSELKLLLNKGLDPKSILHNEKKPKLKRKDSIWYDRETNLLDIAIINAENKNLFMNDDDSIVKVQLLLDAGADHLNTRNYCGWTYLHQTSIPKIVEMLCEKGVDVNSEALSFKFSSEIVRPLDIAIDSQVIDILKKHGATHSDSAPKGLEHLDEKQKLLSAYKSRSLKMFVKLLLNDKQCINQFGEGGWNILHNLFSQYHGDSISEIYDFVDMAESFELRLIKMSIKCGARPLKDKTLRTPLMCLTFHPFARLVTRVIEFYSDFEADHYSLNRTEYVTKLFKLREGGYKSVNTFTMNNSVPIQSIFDQFWASFNNIDNQTFNPECSHDPTIEWNQMMELEKIR